MYNRRRLAKLRLLGHKGHVGFVRQLALSDAQNFGQCSLEVCARLPQAYSTVSVTRENRARPGE